MTKMKSDIKEEENRSEVNRYHYFNLPDGIRFRNVDNNNGLNMHILEAGYKQKGNRPCVLLLHGFPELAYSWRKIMLPLADAGYYVVAPDQRGYGRTTGWNPDYDGDIASFRLLNVARDALALVYALGYKYVSAVIGHDFGSPVAALCGLIRPDIFRSVVLMSTPYSGMPQYPFDTVENHTVKVQDSKKERPVKIEAALAALPRPRKHYQHYYSTREANQDMLNAPQGLHNFLRAYIHGKSGDWKKNKPFPLKEASAEMLANLPSYYIMDLDKGMAETIIEYMPTQTEIDACQWLTDKELKVYVNEYARTGFQGGLNWYRCINDLRYLADTMTYTGLTVDVPLIFISGARDWGIYQKPGALDIMNGKSCTKMQGIQLIEGAGHWVQQERPQEVAEYLIDFLKHKS